MDDFNSFLTRLDDLQTEIFGCCPLVPARKLGLDARCGSLYVGPDFVASTRHSTLEYYGGFEYIDPEYTVTLGQVRLYSCHHPRVQRALHYLNQGDTEE